MGRQGSRALAATITALAISAGPAQAQTAVTIADPAGEQVVSVARLERWSKIAAASLGTSLERRTIEAQVLQMLVTSDWIEGEARARGVGVSRREVETAYRRQKRQSFKKRSEFERFLRSSKQTRDDLRWRVRIDLLSEKVRAHAIAPAAATVTDADVDNYLAQNEPLGTPELRDVRFVVAPDLATARRAKAALKRGATFKQVARRHELERSGELLERTRRGDLPGKLERPIFRAGRGELIGPIKHSDGYFLLKVIRIRPAEQFSLEKSRRTVRGLLVDEAQAAALDEFVDRFMDTWTARTTCARAYDWLRECRNWDGSDMR